MAWTLETANQQLNEKGYIVAMGQFDASIKRRLDNAVKDGRLAKWRARWNAPLGGWGIGPLKTIYGLPELAPQASA